MGSILTHCVLTLISAYIVSSFTSWMVDDEHKRKEEERKRILDEYYANERRLEKERLNNEEEERRQTREGIIIAFPDLRIIRNSLEGDDNHYYSLIDSAYYESNKEILVELLIRIMGSKQT